MERYLAIADEIQDAALSPSSELTLLLAGLFLFALMIHVLLNRGGDRKVRRRRRAATLQLHSTALRRQAEMQQLLNAFERFRVG